MNDNDLAPQVKLALIQREIMEWKQLRYTMEIRHRVNKRVGAPPETMSAVEQELERCEKALDALREMEAELQKEIA